MEITLNKQGSTEGLIKIKVSEGDYQTHVEEKVKDYARKANIRGFRQGKVPAGVIRKMFGKSILVEEINHLLSHKISDYIKENNLKILGEPLPNQDKTRDINWESQKDFEFEYQIGMVEDFLYDLSPNVKVTAYEIEPDKKIIDDTLNDLKMRFGKVSYPEISEAQNTLSGELRAAEGGFKLAPAFIEIEKVEQDEQEKFIGLKEDDEVEFEIDKIYKDEKQIASLLGNDEIEAKDTKGKYIFKVHTIKHTQPLEVNQELFDLVFGEDVVKTEDEFINKIKETIVESYKPETEHLLNRHIEDYFLNTVKINLPDNFLKTWLKFTSKGQVTDSVLEKEYNQYIRELKWDLIKTKIAEDNGIEVDTEEVKNRTKELLIEQLGGASFAEKFGDRLDNYADNYLHYGNGQNYIRLYNRLKYEKVIKFIRGKITLDEKKVSVDDFKKIVEEHKH